MHEILAPGKLSRRLRAGLSGHHLLFDADAIRVAFASPEEPVTREAATEVGHALLAMAREPVRRARSRIAALPLAPRSSLIRLYFRLLDRAAARRALRH